MGKVAGGTSPTLGGQGRRVGGGGRLMGSAAAVRSRAAAAVASRKGVPAIARRLGWFRDAVASREGVRPEAVGWPCPTAQRQGRLREPSGRRAATGRRSNR